MKIKTQWNCGNFTLTHASDISDALVQPLAEIGLLHVMQRDSSIDEVLGIVTKSANGKKVRSKLRRIDVPYSDEIGMALMEKLNSFAVGETKVSVVTAAEPYDREAGAESKFTKEKALATSMESESDFAEKAERCFKAAKLPLDTPTHGDDGEFSPAFLNAIRARLKELAALSNI